MNLLTYEAVTKICNESLNLNLTKDQIKSIKNINSYNNNLILQYRQTGVSSLLDIYLALYLINNPNTNTLILNDKKNNLLKLDNIKFYLDQLAKHDFKITSKGIFNKKDNSGLKFKSPNEQFIGVKYDQIIYDNVNYYNKSIQELIRSIAPILSYNNKNIFVSDNLTMNDNVEYLMNYCYVTVVTDSVK